MNFFARTVQRELVGHGYTVRNNCWPTLYARAPDGQVIGIYVKGLGAELTPEEGIIRGVLERASIHVLVVSNLRDLHSLLLAGARTAPEPSDAALTRGCQARLSSQVSRLHAERIGLRFRSSDVVK